MSAFLFLRAWFIELCPFAVCPWLALVSLVSFSRFAASAEVAAGQEEARSVRKYCTANRKPNPFRLANLCIVPCAPGRKSPWDRIAAASLFSAGCRKRWPPWAALPVWAFRVQQEKRASPCASVRWGFAYLKSPGLAHWLALSFRVVHSEPFGCSDQKQRFASTRP